jgi:hypothetical protein
MTRKQSFIAQRAKEQRTAGKTVNRAALEDRFNKLKATKAGKAQIAKKVGLFNATTGGPVDMSFSGSLIDRDSRAWNGFEPTPTGTESTPTTTIESAPTPTSTGTESTPTTTIESAPTPTPTPTGTGSTPTTTTGSATIGSNATSSAAPSESFRETYEKWLKNQNEQSTAAFNSKLDEIKNLMAAQAAKAYNEQKLLTDTQVGQINEAKAALARDFADRRAMTMEDISSLQDQGRAALSQILRDFGQNRRAGLLGFASRGRGIDPSASRRLINEMQAGQAAALGAANAGTFSGISNLRRQLDQSERDTIAKLADLSRITTYLGTNPQNYFPGVL